MINNIKDVMKSFGFDENQMEKSFDIIYFIGIAQDLAWRKGEGMLRIDININESILNFLKQGIIKESESQYGNFPIYILGEKGKTIFPQLREIKSKENTKILAKNEFKILKQKTYSLFYVDENNKIESLRKLEDYKLNPMFKLLFENSETGNQLKSKFLHNKNTLNSLIVKNNLFLEITEFRSHKILSKIKLISDDQIPNLLLEKIREFNTENLNNIDRLNQKIKFYDNLILSIDFPEKRIGIGNERECQEIAEKLSIQKITTFFNSSDPYYFKIIKPKNFKQFIEHLRQETINRITTPIIKELLEDSIEEFKPIAPYTELEKVAKNEFVEIKAIEVDAEEYKIDLDKKLNVPLYVKFFNPTNSTQTARVDIEAPSFLRSHNNPYPPRDIPPTQEDISDYITETIILVTPSKSGKYNIHLKLLDNEGKVIPNSDKDVSFELFESKTKKFFKFIKGVINITARTI